MQTIKISTWPLEIIDNTGKLIPTIMREKGLIFKILFFMIKKVNDEILKREIRLKIFFEISYGKEARGVKIYDASGGYFHPENLESSAFIGP